VALVASALVAWLLRPKATERADAMVAAQNQAAQAGAASATAGTG
jgi:hypothetical protein